MTNYDGVQPPQRFTTGDSPDIHHADAFRRLQAIMDRLRGPGGCPWDREQTHDSLQQYLIEEAYEVLDAIAARDDAELREELGDVLLQVVFHAQLAAEEGRFSIDDVCRAVCEKLIRRHPHVFGELAVDGSGEVLRNWEQIKLAERARKQAEAALKSPTDTTADDTPPPAHSPIFKGIPRHMPALQRAARVQEKAARVGFDWATLAPVLAKVREEWAELEAELTRVGVADAGNPHLDEARVEAQRGDAPPPPIAEQQLPPEVAEEFGDLLFALTNAARFLRIEPEHALRAATDKFMARYSLAETMARREGHDWHALTLDEMDAWWNKAKLHERAAGAAPDEP